MFRNIVSFWGEELLAPRATPKLVDHPLSAVRDYLFNIFAATLQYWKPFLHPQPENEPCRGDRDTLIRLRTLDLVMTLRVFTVTHDYGHLVVEYCSEGNSRHLTASYLPPVQIPNVLPWSNLLWRSAGKDAAFYAV
jgi:hypothetical protein